MVGRVHTTRKSKNLPNDPQGARLYTYHALPGGIGTSSSFGQGLGFLRSVWRFASRGRTFSIVVPRRRPSSSSLVVVVPRRCPSSLFLVVVPRCSSRSISQAGYGLGAGSATASGTPRGSPRAWRWGRRRRHVSLMGGYDVFLRRTLYRFFSVGRKHRPLAVERVAYNVFVGC